MGIVRREPCEGPAAQGPVTPPTNAQHPKLTVLHQDADFETIAHITGRPVRRIAE